VQKIIQADPERITTSKNAAFAIALATEMFIQHLATTTHNVVKAERKPRRNIQYRDVSSAISKTDNLEFLVDVAPKTSTWGTVKKKMEEKEKEDAKKKEKDGKKDGAVNGQKTLDGAAKTAEEDGVDKDIETPDAMDVDQEAERVENSEPEEDAAAMQIEMEMRGPPRQPASSASKSPEVRRSTGGFTAINGQK
jgi:hypothetical protein